MKFRVVIEQDEDGKFIASCPTLPGCVSDGNTRDEALANIKDAMEGYLASLQKSGDPIPSPITEEIIDVNLGQIEGAA
ncbi:MAG: type II toxin-antitoxin system HicB family antitoxin [Phycisphaerales bacterium]|nr:MAG: type II toxin-antitoxin system HicB family antitoxin [Phycisphaerales bacterium]